MLPKAAMIRTSIIALFALTAICVAVYVIWTLKVSKQRPDSLPTEFKKIDSSLQSANDSLQKKGLGAFKRDSFHLSEVELAIRVNDISRCVDSMKHELVVLTNQKQGTAFSYPDKPRLLVLKKKLADYNIFIQEHFSGKPNIKPGDYISINDVPNGTAPIPWEVYYFQNSNMFAMITELGFINTRVLKLKHKATN